MLYNVKFKFKGTVSKMTCCCSCGQLIDHECTETVTVDTVIDAPFLNEAIDAALTSSGIELMYPHEWLEKPTAIPMAADYAMRFVDAPTLPGMSL